MALWPNLISSELYGASGTLVGLLAWDSTLFDACTFPEGVSADTVVATILMQYGKTPLMHPSPEYMKAYLPIWCARYAAIWEKMYATTTFDYNPIDNLRRKTTYTDTEGRELVRDATVTDESTGETNGEITTSNEVENMVSAENADTYQPDTKNTENGTTNQSQTVESNGTQKTDLTDTEQRQLVHEENAEGSIGVITTQTMIEQERNVSQFNIYDFIAGTFAQEFCLLAW